MKVKFKLEEGAILPKLNNPTDAGIDFFSSEEDIIMPNSITIIKTGVRWEVDEIPEGRKVYMQLKDTSGNAVKVGIKIMAGTIDQDFRGEIGVVVLNTTKQPIKIEKGKKIAQGVIYDIPLYSIEVVSDLSLTDRGEKGFGSSGTAV